MVVVVSATFASHVVVVVVVVVVRVSALEHCDPPSVLVGACTVAAALIACLRSTDPKSVNPVLGVPSIVPFSCAAFCGGDAAARFRQAMHLLIACHCRPHLAPIGAVCSSMNSVVALVASST